MESSRYSKARRLLHILWALAAVVVIVGSLLPSDSPTIKALDALPISDKIDHLAAYAALAFLPAIHEKWRFTFAAALGALALGVALEYVQRYSGVRDFEVGDMVADAAGVCVGLAAGALLRPTRLVRAIRFGKFG